MLLHETSFRIIHTIGCISTRDTACRVREEVYIMTLRHGQSVHNLSSSSEGPPSQFGSALLGLSWLLGSHLITLKETHRLSAMHGEISSLRLAPKREVPAGLCATALVIFLFLCLAGKAAIASPPLLR